MVDPSGQGGPRPGRNGAATGGPGLPGRHEAGHGDQGRGEARSLDGAAHGGIHRTTRQLEEAWSDEGRRHGQQPGELGGDEHTRQDHRALRGGRRTRAVAACAAGGDTAILQRTAAGGRMRRATVCRGLRPDWILREPAHVHRRPSRRQHAAYGDASYQHENDGPARKHGGHSRRCKRHTTASDPPDARVAAASVQRRKRGARCALGNAKIKLEAQAGREHRGGRKDDGHG